MIVDLKQILRAEATHKEFLSVRREGPRDVQRQVSFYNLDGITSRCIQKVCPAPAILGMSLFKSEPHG